MEESHKVQSVRAVVEQTIRDLKCFKIMSGNKIKAVAEFEQVLDCVVALHNLRVLLKGDQEFDLPARRAAVPVGDLLLRENVMVSTNLVFVTEMEWAARRTRREQKRSFYCR